MAADLAGRKPTRKARTLLFRAEASQARYRLQGNVSLAPPVRWQVLGIFLVVTVLLAIAFLSVFTYGRHVTATGEIAGNQGVVTVSPPRLGTLTRILVREGEAVRAGQPLAQIGFDTVAGEGSLERRRAIALDEEASALAAKGVADHAVADAKIAALRSGMEGRQVELGELAMQTSEQRRLVSLAQEDLDRTRGVAERGFVSRREIGLREQSLVERRQALAQLQREHATLMAEQAKATAEVRLERAGVAAARADAARARGQLAGASAADTMQRGMVIVAPVSGRVTGVVAMPGEVAGPGKAMLSIVPAQTRLVARLAIPPAGVGFVQPGQPVMLSIDAFPRETFGTVRARIAYVTAATVPGRNDSAPTFLAEAVIERPSIAAYGAQQPLLPGMGLSAVVTTRRLSLMRWLLDPLYAVMTR